MEKDDYYKRQTFLWQSLPVMERNLKKCTYIFIYITESLSYCFPFKYIIYPRIFIYLFIYF